ncbi:hypothetical protein [Falsiroseomonas ponticola]|uniref:hypothetical protein n=1 Tax=Falsiroseomonas ponticola TaxID=2786951 RepID=UPI0019315250|nr:hypothetical protein [Roseomonas ponticola]
MVAETAAYDGLPETLEYSGEFGTELIIFLPFVTWLSEAGLLRDRYVKSYKGMGCFYAHVACKRFIEKDDTRGWVRLDQRPRWLPIRHEDTFDRTYAPCAHHSYPDLRALFSQADLRSSRLNGCRPILVVHNKYNREWKFRQPINYLTLKSLRSIFEAYSSVYQIVYIRHGLKPVGETYSHDRNAFVADFQDAALLLEYPNVLSFDDIFDEHIAKGGCPDINLVKNAIYARSYHFISAQGGGTYQCAYYSGSLLMIQHRTGIEHSWPYIGYFRYLAKPPVHLAIATSEAALIAGLPIFDSPAVRDGAAQMRADRRQLAQHLDAGRPELLAMPLYRDLGGVPPPL